MSVFISGLLDDFLVGVILLAGFGYAAYALGPKSLRARMLAVLASAAGHLPAVLGARGLAARLATKAQSKAGGACGGCGSCASASPASSASSAEVRVPLAKIAKRR